MPLGLSTLKQAGKKISTPPTPCHPLSFGFKELKGESAKVCEWEVQGVMRPWDKGPAESTMRNHTIWKDRQQSRQQLLILPAVKDKNYNSLAGELAIILSVYALKGFSVWKKKLACKAGNPLALTCTRIKTTYDQLARQKHGSSIAVVSLLCAAGTLWAQKDLMHPQQAPFL